MSVDVTPVRQQEGRELHAVDVWYETASQVQLLAPRREGTTAAQQKQERANYEPGSIEALICSVFVEDCGRAIRIARCESGLNPYARNRSGAVGLFQLLGHGDMFEAHGWSASDWSDPWKNTVVAHDLYLSSGWRPWVCR